MVTDENIGQVLYYLYDHQNGLPGYRTGNPLVRINYVNGVMHGTYQTWFDDKRLRFVGTYVNGVLEGEEIECIY